MPETIQDKKGKMATEVENVYELPEKECPRQYNRGTGTSVIKVQEVDQPQEGDARDNTGGEQKRQL